jgi:hypothetical protein
MKPLLFALIITLAVTTGQPAMAQDLGTSVVGTWKITTKHDGRSWRANFFPVGIAHSIVGGTAWEPTPWRAAIAAADSVADRSALAWEVGTCR